MEKHIYIPHTVSEWIFLSIITTTTIDGVAFFSSLMINIWYICRHIWAPLETVHSSETKSRSPKVNINQQSEDKQHTGKENATMVSSGLRFVHEEAKSLHMSAVQHDSQHRVADHSNSVLAQGGIRWLRESDTDEMFYVNDVIWFSNPLQSLTQTDSHDSIGLIPFPLSLYCCVSLSPPPPPPFWFHVFKSFHPFKKSNILLWYDIVSMAASCVSRGSQTQASGKFVVRKWMRAERSRSLPCWQANGTQCIRVLALSFSQLKQSFHPIKQTYSIDVSYSVRLQNVLEKAASLTCRKESFFFLFPAES